MHFYDRIGVWVLAKRLETGTFSWPDPAHHVGEKISLTPEALHLLFDGVDLRGATLRPWYQRDEKIILNLSTFPRIGNDRTEVRQA